MNQREKIQTSLDAYHSLEPKQLTEIYGKILMALSVINEGTFEDIAAYLKIDKSRVWKRLSELASMQLIYRTQNRRMLKSGRSGFTWRLCNPEKTEQVSRETLSYKLGEKSAADYASKIINHSQIELF
jgi:predicted transcriptional regulator